MHLLGSFTSCPCTLSVRSVFFYAGYKISLGEADKGFRLAALNGLALAVIMGIRFAKTKKFMPAGMLSTVGLGAGAYYGKLYYDFTKD